jgi:hypothetical protein
VLDAEPMRAFRSPFLDFMEEDAYSSVEERTLILVPAAALFV